MSLGCSAKDVCPSVRPPPSPPCYLKKFCCQLSISDAPRFHCRIDIPSNHSMKESDDAAAHLVELLEEWNSTCRGTSAPAGCGGMKIPVGCGGMKNPVASHGGREARDSARKDGLISLRSISNSLRFARERFLDQDAADHEVKCFPHFSVHRSSS